MLWQPAIKIETVHKTDREAVKERKSKKRWTLDDLPQGTRYYYNVAVAPRLRVITGSLPLDWFPDKKNLNPWIRPPLDAIEALWVKYSTEKNPDVPLEPTGPIVVNVRSDSLIYSLKS
jgi:hypothetical protein